MRTDIWAWDTPVKATVNDAHHLYSFEFEEPSVTIHFEHRSEMEAFHATIGKALRPPQTVAGSWLSRKAGNDV